MRNTRILQAAALAFALGSAGNVWAAVSAAEAAKLKGELTPMGAEKAGNKEGTIPAWTGGYTTPAPGYTSGAPRPDPFAGEKLLYSITAANMAQHLDKLSDGQQAMLKQYPTYRIDVYPTHRTAAAPQYVYDNTFKNATRAKTSPDGNSVEGAYGGVPFPIPKSGHEVMWNHLLRWMGESTVYEVGSWVVAGGRTSLAAATTNEMQYPYFFKDVPFEKFNGDYWQIYQVATAPSHKAGETILLRDPVDQVGKGRQAWQYLVGQRRVRKAPSLAYDTPDHVTSGVDLMDEVSLFIGALDRFDWKLIGKKEILIPYNVNKSMSVKVDQLVGPHHLNPDYLRWELHRVWVVEATLKAGVRHVMPKRRYYLDEDTWAAALYDGWDARGQLWHVAEALMFAAPEFPAVIQQAFTTLDIQKGTYQATIHNGQPSHYKAMPRWPDSYFTPETMATRGVR